MSKKWIFGWFVAGVITGLAAVNVFYTLIFPGPEIVATDEELAELRQIEKSNPEADAISALRHGDGRLLSVMGFAEHVPVATGDVTDRRLLAKHGVRIIRGTTDCSKGKEQFRLQPIAHEYARKYNCVILREAVAASMITQALADLESEDLKTRETAAQTILSNQVLSTNVIADVEDVARKLILDDARKGAAKTAVLLLGKLKSERSIPFLIEHLTFHVPLRAPNRLELIKFAYPCTVALTDIGEPAFPALLARWLNNDDLYVDRCVMSIFLHAKDRKNVLEFLAKQMQKVKTEKDRSKVLSLMESLAK